jgi:hypothetical protein
MIHVKRWNVQIFFFCYLAPSFHCSIWMAGWRSVPLSSWNGKRRRSSPVYKQSHYRLLAGVVIHNAHEGSVPALVLPVFDTHIHPTQLSYPLSTSEG